MIEKTPPPSLTALTTLTVRVYVSTRPPSEESPMIAGPNPALDRWQALADEVRLGDAVVRYVHEFDWVSFLEASRKFLAPLESDERAQLEANIAADGCRDPLVLWKDGERHVLIDGHNRYEICAALGVKFQTKTLALADRKAVHDWMINCQLGRRNITAERMSYLRGTRYNNEKNDNPGRPSKELAKGLRL